MGGSLLRKAAFLKSLIEVNALLSLRGGRATISLERKERGAASHLDLSSQAYLERGKDAINKTLSTPIT